MKNVFCITNDYGDVTPRAQLMESYLLMSSNFNKNNACEVREIGGDYTAVSSSTPQSRVSKKCIQKAKERNFDLARENENIPNSTSGRPHRTPNIGHRTERAPSQNRRAHRTISIAMPYQIRDCFYILFSF